MILVFFQLKSILKRIKGADFPPPGLTPRISHLWSFHRNSTHCVWPRVPAPAGRHPVVGSFILLCNKLIDQQGLLTQVWGHSESFPWVFISFLRKLLWRIFSPLLLCFQSIFHLILCKKKKKNLKAYLQGKNSPLKVAILLCLHYLYFLCASWDHHCNYLKSKNWVFFPLCYQWTFKYHCFSKFLS